MNLPIVNAFLDDDGKYIIAFERDGEEIKERRTRAEYTTFHPKEMFDAKMMRILKHSPHVTHIEEVGKYTRIGWKNDIVRRQARYKFYDEGITTFEGDVDPVRYWLTETKPTIAKPRRAYLDIEADSRVSFSKKEDMRILVWAISDDTGPIARGVLKEDTDASERVLLQKLWKILSRYDQVAAWYGGDPDEKDEGFDFYVIAKRSQRMGLPIDTRRWLWLDQLVAWRRMNQHAAESGAEKESMRLEDMAQSQLGEGKEKTPAWVIEKFGDKNLAALSWELWNEGGEYRKLLVEYCVKDTELLRKLEAKKGYLTLFQTVCEVCTCFANTRSLQPTVQMDGFLLRLGREKDHRFPTKRYGDDISEKFKGAYVMAPRTVGDDDKDSEWSNKQAEDWRHKHNHGSGILRNVHVCDFASLYPTIIITWNLSEDVKCDDPDLQGALLAGEDLPDNVCRSPGTGVLTYTDRKGILADALNTMLQLRKEWKAKAVACPPGTPEWQDMMSRSNAYKVAANSFYGVTGASSSRYFNREIAESTTQNGVWLIKQTIKEAEKRKMIPVYSDTDSVFVIGPTSEGYTSFIKWCNNKFYPKIIAETGAKENRISVAFEKTFSRLIFTAAKRYIGRYSQYGGKEATKDSKPEIKGLEYKRGDTVFLARRLQGQVIDLLVGGVKEKDEDGVEYPINPDIETPTDDLEEYFKVLTKMRNHVLNDKVNPTHVRLSQSLSKPLKEYKNVSNAHLTVAKILEARGRDVGKGTRIEYVVVDGDVSPMKVIPFEDFNGEFDRFYLWETRVFPPTQRLLEAAFPHHDWASWAQVRPPKPKKRGKKVAEEQLGFQLDSKVSTRVDTDLAVPTYSSKPLVIRVPEIGGSKILDKLKKLFTKHPGARSVEFIIDLQSGGEATLKSSARVATSEKFKEQVDEIISQYSEAS